MFYLRVLYRHFLFLRFSIRFPKAKFGGLPVVSIERMDNVFLSEGVIFGSYGEIVQSNYGRDVECKLLIGRNVVIGSGFNLRAGGGSIIIEDLALLAQNVTIIAANHQIQSSKPHRYGPVNEEKTDVTIGKNVWIAAGVVIMPGVTIGANSIIGAGSVVTKDIPKGELWAGVPARRIKII